MAARRAALPSIPPPRRKRNFLVSSNSGSRNRSRTADDHDLRAARWPEPDGRLPVRGDETDRHDHGLPGELFIRTDIAQLGIAPLTSMYWFGENDRQYASDWRPEIHDSDGLALWTGKGERIWRPLIDPPSVLANSFLDENPKGFGLMQRDRDFADYQDDGAFYNRRPSMWVETKGNWGPAPCNSWKSPRRTRSTTISSPTGCRRSRSKPATSSISPTGFTGRTTIPTAPKDVGRVTATRIGRGGVPGQPAPDDKDKLEIRRRFRRRPSVADGAALRRHARGNDLARQNRQGLCHQDCRHRPLAGAFRHPRARQAADQFALFLRFEARR